MAAAASAASLTFLPPHHLRSCLLCLTTQVTESRASQSAVYAHTEVEDLVAFDFTCSNPHFQRAGIRGSARWDFAQPKGRGKREMLRIVGTSKTVEARPLASDGLTIYSHSEHPLPLPNHVPCPTCHLMRCTCAACVAWNVGRT